MNVCSRAGWVVDGRAMPTDPIDHDAARVPKLGCTALRCGSCGQKVRSIGGKRIASGSREARDLFEASDVSTVTTLVDSKMRIYFCRCMLHTESGQHPLDDTDGGVGVPWSCSGHPIATLPHGFDGVIIAETNLDALVAQVLAGDVPPGAHTLDHKGAHWIARLCVRLEGTPHARSVATCVAKRLLDPDLKTRTRAVHFFTTLARFVDTMNAAALLGDHASLFVGVADEFADIKTEPTLEHAIWRLAGDQLAIDPALREVARRVAKDPVRATYVVFVALVRGDLAWFTDHAEELARRHPARIADLLAATRDHVALHARIKSLSPE